MITFMRRYRRGLQVGLLLVIAAFVASLFVFGASGRGGGDAATTVATVNGEEISVDRYQRRYQEYLNAYAQMLRDRFSPELAERFGLPRQVVEDLVQEALIVQRARAEGMEVSDEELNAQIHSMPVFSEGGRFSLKRYEEVLRRLGYTKSTFEGEMRRQLTRLKVERLVRGGAKVSDGEIEQAFAHNREEVRAAWALVEFGPLMTSATVTEEELKAFLRDHADAFRQPDRRRIQYVVFDPKTFTQPVPEADVQKYYAEHASEYEKPRQVHAAHILVRVPDTGGSEAEDRARAKVADAIRRLRAGADFAKLAKEISEDPATASRGGDLGFVSRGELVPAFEQALFALKKGEITPEPVRTTFGFHAIKAEEIREGGKRPLTEVSAQIRGKLVNEAADRAARTKADEARAKLLGAADFMAQARQQGLTPLESVVARKESVPGLMAPDPLEEMAFSVAEGGVSPPVKTPAGYVVLRTTQSLTAAVPPLDEIKDKVANAVRRQKAEAQALDKARQIVADAQNGDLAAAARKVGATSGDTPRFSRTRPADRLPGDAMLAALKTPVGGLSEPIKTTPGYYVLKVLERVPPDPGGLVTEREKIAGELLARKQGQAWEAWLTGARSKAKIEISSQLPRRRG